MHRVKQYIIVVVQDVADSRHCIGHNGVDSGTRLQVLEVFEISAAETMILPIRSLYASTGASWKSDFDDSGRRTLRD